MDRKSLAKAVASSNKISCKCAENAIIKTFDIIAEKMSEEERVTISGFGTFEVKHRRARSGRNPQNNTEIKIPERAVPHFRAHRKLKESVNKKDG